MSSSYVIDSGITSSGINLTGGDRLTVNSGGTAFKTMAKDGGDIDVSSGGLAISTTVSSGGSMAAYGVVSETKLMAGTLNLYGYSSCSAASTIVSGMDFLSGNSWVTVWGDFHVGNSSYASVNQIYSAGSMDVHGYAISNTVDSGGIIYVDWYGGKISSTTISSGGRLNIVASATANETTVHSGGMGQWIDHPGKPDHPIWHTSFQCSC